MRSMQCNVEFGYQLIICSGTKENHGGCAQLQVLAGYTVPGGKPYDVTCSVSLLCYYSRFHCYMFRSYDHLQEGIYLSEITLVTTDSLLGR
jgi:hypothetical protein